MYINYVLFFARCRFYVQPQWIFDSINRRSKLNERDYALGRLLWIFIRLFFFSYSNNLFWESVKSNIFFPWGNMSKRTILQIFNSSKFECNLYIHLDPDPAAQINADSDPKPWSWNKKNCRIASVNPGFIFLCRHLFISKSKGCQDNRYNLSYL